MGWKRTTQLCQCIIILLFIIWQYVVFNISWNNELDPLKFPPSYVDRFYIFLIMITNFITWIFIAELIETHFYLVTIIEIENAHFEADCIWLSFRSNHQLLFFGMLINHPFPKSFFFWFPPLKFMVQCLRSCMKSWYQTLGTTNVILKVRTQDIHYWHFE